MLNTHAPEFRKILWGGLVAWLIQGAVILAWSLEHDDEPIVHAAVHAAVPEAQAHASFLFAGSPPTP
jgi:hypothetical protein